MNNKIEYKAGSHITLSVFVIPITDITVYCKEYHYKSIQRFERFSFSFQLHFNAIILLQPPAS